MYIGPKILHIPRITKRNNWKETHKAEKMRLSRLHFEETRELRTYNCYLEHYQSLNLTVKTRFGFWRLPLVPNCKNTEKISIYYMDLLTFCVAPPRPAPAPPRRFWPLPRPGDFDPCLSPPRPAPKIFTLAPPRSAPWEKTLPRPSLLSTLSLSTVSVGQVIVGVMSFYKIYGFIGWKQSCDDL